VYLGRPDTHAWSAAEAERGLAHAPAPVGGRQGSPPAAAGSAAWALLVASDSVADVWLSGTTAAGEVLDWLSGCSSSLAPMGVVLLQRAAAVRLRAVFVMGGPVTVAAIRIAPHYVYLDPISTSITMKRSCDVAAVLAGALVGKRRSRLLPRRGGLCGAEGPNGVAQSPWLVVGAHFAGLRSQRALAGARAKLKLARRAVRAAGEAAAPSKAGSNAARLGELAACYRVAWWQVGAACCWDAESSQRRSASGRQAVSQVVTSHGGVRLTVAAVPQPAGARRLADADICAVWHGAGCRRGSARRKAAANLTGASTLA
jgi:hypothetical protein